ncbi:MAG: glutaredoxin family protein [Anaerolineae bacterium]|nr:glutaredoxin family protein [Anaerolineae bacterium]
MPQSRGRVSGSRNEHSITFYGLSTCVWCRRTRQLLEEQDVQFDFVYVDLLQGAAKEEAVEQVRRWNPAVSFPTVVIDEATCIVGYRPDEIEEALKQ